MAWQSSLVIMVRQLVNDLGSTEEFSDARIEEAIAVAAIIVINDYPFDTEYVVDLELPNITPDPVTTYDPLAIALFSLKAACILNMATVSSNAPNLGIRVRDGDTEIENTGGTLKGYELILNQGPCATYKSLVDTNYLQNNMGIGKAIYGPYGDGSLSLYNGNIDLQNGRLFFDYWLR